MKLKFFSFRILILILISLNLAADQNYLISLKQISGLSKNHLYCQGASSVSYNLLIGNASKTNLIKLLEFSKKIKKHILGKNLSTRKLTKFKKQLILIKKIYKQNINLCKIKITELVKNNSNNNRTIICGNGILEDGEDCDDGDTSNENICLNNCKRSFCGDGILQTSEICIKDHPVAQKYLNLREKLRVNFCQKSFSDSQLNPTQISLISSINLMLSRYLQGFDPKELSDSINRLESETNQLLANCIKSNFTPLGIVELRSLINSPIANSQAKLVSENFQHHLAKLTCHNFPALNNFQFDYINYFNEYDPDVYNWYLDFIEYCDSFQSGKIYDVNLDQAYEDGLNFQVTYSSCEYSDGFIPKSKLIGENLDLSLIYPNLSTTCLNPQIRSKAVYVTTGSNTPKNIKLTFNDYKKDFNNIIPISLVKNTNVKINYLNNLPLVKASSIPGIYDGFYAYQMQANGQTLPLSLINSHNISQNLWSNLKTIAPISQTSTTVPIFETYNYNPSIKSTWSKHPLISSLDFTGVAWENDKAGTLITRQHILVAAHFRRDVGDTVMFNDKDGNAVIRRVIAIKSLEHDICIAKLDSPVPAGIKHYKLLYHDIDITGAPAIITDRFKLAGIKQVANIWNNGYITNNVNGTHDRTITFTKPNNEYKDSNRGLTPGDSGHPSFIIINGELVLLETHTSAGGGPNYSSFLNQEMIRKAISDLWILGRFYITLCILLS